MENIEQNNRLKDAVATQNILKAEYEYLLNREKKLIHEKELILTKLLKLKAVLASTD